LFFLGLDSERLKTMLSANGTNGANGKNHQAHKDWTTDSRWSGITRPYSRSDVLRLRGSFQIEYTLARLGAERLWDLMHTEPYVAALGAITGNQAIEMVQAGLKAIYGSGWQVAADNNTAGDVYPDQSLYPCDSAPNLVKRINRALLRADQIESVDRAAIASNKGHSGLGGNHDGEKSGTYWLAPIVADAEAGFGGSLNAYELMKAMIEAGAAGVHFEDQLSSAKKCGHLGGKVVVPTREFIEKLVAARLAADVCGVPTILIARTDANSAGLLLSDADPRDREFVYGERTAEGFFQFRGGIDAAIARSLAYAPYADMLWCETSTPDLAEAKKFADAIHTRFPGKLLAYNCSPSFNWKKKLDEASIASFQQELGKMGYKFQFVTLAGFHALNMSMFQLARGYAHAGMTAYSKLQQEEFAAQELGYRAVTHQRFVGTGYFDEIAQVVSGGNSSTTALSGSTEAAQFHRA
jgi:isocitrate lyase